MKETEYDNITLNLAVLTFLRFSLSLSLSLQCQLSLSPVSADLVGLKPQPSDDEATDPVVVTLHLLLTILLI